MAFNNIKKKIKNLLNLQAHTNKSNIYNISMSMTPELTRYQLHGKNIENPKFKRRTCVKPVDLIQKYKMKNYFKQFVKRFKSLTPLHYQNEYNFKQNWEQNEENYENSVENQNLPLISEFNEIIRGIQIINMVNFCVVLWYLSIELFFCVQTNNIFYILFFISILIEISLEINTTKNTTQKIIKNRTEAIIYYLKKNFYQDFVSLSIIIVKSLSIFNSYILIIQIFTLIILINKISRKYYKYFRSKFIDGQQYQKKYGLVELFLFMIVMAHFFGCLLHYATTLNSQTDWLTYKDLNDKSWDTKYIYSIYWASTTMLTVGFGDISPQNHYQVIVIMIVEYVGVAMFGYIINVIGITMNEIKSASQKINQQIKTVDRISKCFGLNPDLTERIKQFIKNTNKALQTFSIVQEKEMINKLSHHLKSQILHETNIKVLKKNIFFITNFTKTFQDQLALKLTKRIFQPDEPIIADLNNKSLFLIQQGKLDIYFKKKHVHKQNSKLVESKQIKQTSKIYGYVEFITQKLINLFAISRKITVAYQLKKSDFMEEIASNPKDLEFYFQLRDEINLYHLPEQLQAPALKDYLLHYIPINHLIIKKYQHSKYQNRKNLKYIRNKKRINHFANLQKNSGTNFESNMINQIFRHSSRQEYQGSSKSINNIIITKSDQIHRIQIIKQYEFYKKNHNFRRVIKKYNQFIIRKRKTNEESTIQNEQNQ